MSDHPKPSAAPEAGDAVPLCVDLDGTLIACDTLMASIRMLLARKPWMALAMAWWLRRGRAHLKDEVARRVLPDPARLPYRREVLDFVKAERAKGRRALLVTATDRRIAERVAAHVGLFDEVMASDGSINLRGANKAAALVARFGEGRFDYAGDSRVDLPVWAAARLALVAGAPRGLRERMRRAGARIIV